MDWTLRKFFAVQMIIVCTAFVWPNVAHAAGLQKLAAIYEWELIVSALIVTIPVGAWLGVSIPPPTGYESTAQWPKFARYLCGLIVGACTAIYLGESMKPLAITIIPPSVLAAICGASLMSVLQKRVVNGANND